MGKSKEKEELGVIGDNSIMYVSNESPEDSNWAYGVKNKWKLKDVT